MAADKNDKFVQLSDMAVIAKKSATSDFTFQSDAGTVIPSEVEATCNTWLQTHVRGGNSESILAARIAGSWWLLRAVSDRGSDASGRPLYYLALARVVEIDDRSLGWLVLSSIQNEVPNRGASARQAPLSPRPEPISAKAQLVALALAMGETMGVLEDPAQVAAVLDELGSGVLDFVALSSPALPAELPGKCGLVISKAAWNVPGRIAEFAKRLGGRRVPNLGGLARLAVSGARREELACLALGTSSKMTSELTADEAAWLLDTPLRPALLAQASGSAVHTWLQNGRITAAEIQMVADRLRPQDGLLVAPLLAQQPGALETFAGIFGKGADGIELLLKPDTRLFWDWLKNGCTSKEPASWRQGITEELARAGLLDRLPLSALAATQQTGRAAQFRSFFQEKLLQAGLPAIVLRALEEREDLASPPSSPAAPEPESAWLGAFSFNAVRKLGTAVVQERGWRHWWLFAMRRHPAAGPFATFGWDGQWCEELGVFLEAELRDTVQNNDLVPLLARLRRENAPVAELIRLLAVREPGLATIAGCICLETPWNGGEIERSQIDSARRLLAAGFLDKEEALAALGRDLPVAAVDLLGCPDAVSALLDARRNPPAEPPAGWEKSFRPLLARSLEQPGFWIRWPEGISPALLEWICEEIAEQTNATLPRTIAAARNGSRLSPSQLENFGGALGREALLNQVIQWAHGASDSRTAAIESICKQPVLGDLAPWLRSELLPGASQAAEPELTPRESVLLWPLLQGIRQRIRQIMRMNSRKEGETELLEIVMKNLSTLAVAPLPEPQVHEAIRRPDWVRALASVPGWDHWASTITTTGQDGRK